MITYTTTDADESTFGPQKYAVENAYDHAGRLINEKVVDNTVRISISTRHDTELIYDGMGRLARERILKVNASSK